MPKSPDDWNQYVSNLTFADEKLKSFLVSKEKAYQTKDLATFKQYLQDTNKTIDIATFKMKAFAVAKNLALNIGIGLLMMGVSKIIQGIDGHIHKIDKLKETLETAKQEYATTKNELESVNKEFETISKRIDELEKKDNLTFTEKEEYENLVAQGDELKRQNDILEKRLQLKNQDKNKAFTSIMDEKSKGKMYIPDGNGGQIELAGEDKAKYWDDISIEKYIAAKNSQDEEAMATYAQQMSDRLDEYAEMTKDISYISNPETKDEEAVNNWLDFIADYQDRVMIALQNDNAKTNALNRLLNHQDFEDVGDELRKLADNGSLTGDAIKNIITPSSELYNKLVDLGVIAEDDDTWFNALANTYNNAKSKTEDLSESTDTLKDSLSSLSEVGDALSSLSTATKEVTDDGYVSIGTLSKIKEEFASVPEIDTYISQLAKAKTNSSEFQQVLANLTVGLIDSKFTTEELADADESLIVSMLRSANVANADSVAHQLITRAKETLRIQTALANATTAEAVVALATEASQAGITGAAFNNLVLDIGIFNNTALDVSGKIAALQELGYYARWSASGISSINSVKKTTVDGKSVISSYDEKGRLRR